MQRLNHGFPLLAKKTGTETYDMRHVSNVSCWSCDKVPPVSTSLPLREKSKNLTNVCIRTLSFYFFLSL